MKTLCMDDLFSVHANLLNRVTTVLYLLRSLACGELVTLGCSKIERCAPPAPGIRKTSKK